MKTETRHLLLCTLLVLSGTPGCDPDRTTITINLSGLTSDIRALRLLATLDNQMQTEQRYSPAAQIGLRLPPGAQGQVRLDVSGLSAAECVIAQGSAQVTEIVGAVINIGMQLAPFTDPSCQVIPPQCTTHAQCAAENPAKPACVAGRCQPCTRNYQCRDSACDEDGRCHPAARVIFVDDRGTCRRSGGAAGQPYCYLREAVQDSDLATGAKDLILVRSTKLLDGAFIEPSRSVRIIGARSAAGTPPVLVSESFRFRRTNAATFGLEDLHISATQSGASGIECGGGMVKVSLDVRWSQVDKAAFWGLGSDGCQVTIVSSRFSKNNYGGVVITGGTVTLRNAMLTDNGIGLMVTNATSTEAAFNTIAGNQCQDGVGCDVRCKSGTVLRYSLLPGMTTSGSIQGCTLENSYVPSDYGAGTGNLKGLMLSFTDPANGDYHLNPNNAENKKLRKDEPSPLPIAYDIDGEPRAGVGGVIVGADQIPLP